MTASGTHLIEVHDWLRDELDRLREQVEAYLGGDGERPRELRAHCLLFCSAVTQHHTGEDDLMFPALAERFPDLRPALEQLARDHILVAGIMRALEELVASLAEEVDDIQARHVRGELEGLAALLESHFTYEEKRLVDALNATGAR
jgi:hemerythrin-like domain-containing protein